MKISCTLRTLRVVHLGFESQSRTLFNVQMDHLRVWLWFYFCIILQKTEWSLRAFVGKSSVLWASNNIFSRINQIIVQKYLYVAIRFKFQNTVWHHHPSAENASEVFEVQKGQVKIHWSFYQVLMVWFWGHHLFAHWTVIRRNSLLFCTLLVFLHTSLLDLQSRNMILFCNLLE